MPSEALHLAPIELAIPTAPSLELVEAVSEPLTPGPINEREQALITATSRGKSFNQLTERFGHKHLIRSRYENLQGKFGVPTVAAVVHQVIEQQMIEVEREENPEIVESLDRMDFFAIRCMARGITEKSLAPKLDRPEDEVFRSFNRAVTNVGARSRPHAVRRGHELGIFRVAGASPGQTLPASR
jgi:hypothetical protein